MKMPDRYVYLDFHIDANRINAKVKSQYMNQLENWHDNNVINIEMSQVAQNEAGKGSGARFEKASGYVYSLTMAGTPIELKDMEKIEMILFPKGANSPNEKNDVEIVFNAFKYCCILVTNDGGSKRQPGGILGNRAQLYKEVGVKIIRDSEAVELVQKKIKERDNRCLWVKEKTGLPLPVWVGKD